MRLSPAVVVVEMCCGCRRYLEGSFVTKDKGDDESGTSSAECHTECSTVKGCVSSCLL